MRALLDTGFLLAVLDADDALHPACRDVLLAEREPLLPDVVLPELAHLVLRELGYSILTRFLRSLAEGELSVVRLEVDALPRIAELLDKYSDSRVDFVDCCIVALAERLDIDRILTVDRRHFGLFRPRHRTHLTLLP